MDNLERQKFSRDIITILCLLQFLILLGVVHLFFHPLTRAHMAFVGLSGVVGLLISGAARRRYEDFKENNARHKQFTTLDETLKKLDE